MKAIETASIPVIKAMLSMKAVAKEMGKVVGDDYEDSELPIDITFDDSPQDGTFGVQTVQQQASTNEQWHQQQQQNMIMQIPAPLQSLFTGDFGINLLPESTGFGFGGDFGAGPQQKCHLGLASCNLLTDYVRTYPCLREVALLLKRFLAVNDLNSAYQGKLA